MVAGCSSSSGTGDSPSPVAGTAAPSQQPVAKETGIPDGSEDDQSASTSGQTGKNDNPGPNGTTDSGDPNQPKEPAIDPKYDARQTAQTTMNLDPGVPAAFQNAASPDEQEKYRKKAAERRKARLAARERQRGSGVDAPVSSIGETITINPK